MRSFANHSIWFTHGKSLQLKFGLVIYGKFSKETILAGEAAPQCQVQCYQDHGSWVQRCYTGNKGNYKIFTSVALSFYWLALSVGSTLAPLYPFDPKSCLRRCVTHWREAIWAGNIPSILTFSALARSMTSPAYPPTKNRFGNILSRVASGGGDFHRDLFHARTEYFRKIIKISRRIIMTWGVGVPIAGFSSWGRKRSTGAGGRGCGLHRGRQRLPADARGQGEVPVPEALAVVDGEGQGLGSGCRVQVGAPWLTRPAQPVRGQTSPVY
jgi:hypothetical protein